VRILAGRWKGRRLPVPATARPTSGRARQALFNLLRERVDGARVLDLYAGSGAVGLEAVSRGAASAVLVEPDGDALLRSLREWEVEPPEVRVLSGSVTRALRRLVGDGEHFDVVFADPPYSRGIVADLSDVSRVLAEGGVLVLQGDSGSSAPEIPGLREIAERAYGRNVFHFLGVL
jgi:16S rRNA (guanine966-N2)-methyltransferase